MLDQSDTGAVKIHLSILAMLTVGGIAASLNLLPAFEHWVSIPAGVLLATAIFTAIGLFVGVQRMSLNVKLVPWLIVTGVTATSLGLYALALSDYKASNFCFFRADFSRPMPSGGYEWQLINDQHRPIDPMRTCLFEGPKGERHLRCWTPEQSSYCHSDSIDLTTSTARESPIKAGDHFFKFQTNNSWEQSLVIRETNEGPKQLGIIYRDGQEIQRFGNLNASDEKKAGPFQAKHGVASLIVLLAIGLIYWIAKAKPSRSSLNRQQALNALGEIRERAVHRLNDWARNINLSAADLQELQQFERDIYKNAEIVSSSEVGEIRTIHGFSITNHPPNYWPQNHGGDSRLIIFSERLMRIREFIQRNARIA